MEDNKIIDNLLNEYIEHRSAIKIMIVDLEKLKDKIETILPEKMDKRFKFFFEEKIKTITQLFSSLLDMRKEIAKSVKDEIELRRKITKETDKDDSGFEDLLDIRKIANKVESFQKKQQDFKNGTKKIELEG
jgi:hypothetical protein